LSYNLLSSLVHPLQTCRGPAISDSDHYTKTLVSREREREREGKRETGWCGCVCGGGLVRLNSKIYFRKDWKCKPNRTVFIAADYELLLNVFNYHRCFWCCDGTWV